MKTYLPALLGVVFAYADNVAAAPPQAAPTEAPASKPPAAHGRDDSSDPARAAARAALALGNKRLKEGDVAGAIEEYRRAQASYPQSAAKIEFNIAKAEEARGNEPAAAAAFERFLSRASEIQPEYREEARSELHRLSKVLGSLKLARTSPGYDVVVDGQPHGKAPLDGGVWVRPGHHVITLEENNYVVFREAVDVTGGATVQIMVTLHPGDPRVGPIQPSLSVAKGPQPSARILGSSGDPPQGGEPGVPVWKRWWFWTAAGAIVATSATLVLLRTRPDCPVVGGVRRSVDSEVAGIAIDEGHARSLECPSGCRSGCSRLLIGISDCCPRSPSCIGRTLVGSCARFLRWLSLHCRRASAWATEGSRTAAVSTLP